MNGQKLEKVTSFKYLGPVITDEGSKPELLCGIAQTTAALTRLKPVWIDKSISHSSKIRLMRSLVTSIFLFASESWTLTVEFQRRIQAMEMRCYRKILHISYKDHVTNYYTSHTKTMLPTRKSVPRETQTAVVWSCFLFIRSGQNCLARHSERGKKTRWTKEEVGRQNQGMDRPGVRQVQEGSGEQGKMEKTGCKIICGASKTLAVKGLMMMMMSCILCKPSNLFLT